jgi:hypothetical protein
MLIAKHYQLGGAEHARRMRAKHPEKACAECLLRLGLGFKLVSRMVPALNRNQTFKLMRGLGVRSVRRNSDMAKALMQMRGQAVRRARGGAMLASMALTAQLGVWRMEWRGVSAEDCAHWKNHPEYLRWHRNAIVRRNAKRYASAKTNYHISKLLRSRVLKVLNGMMKSAPTLELLGCSLEYLRQHLQSRFRRGMTWGNHGKRWHIDHIIPCASWDLSDPRQQRLAFHFTNLRPLGASENRRKHAKVTEPQMALRLGPNERRRLLPP